MLPAEVGGLDNWSLMAVEDDVDSSSVKPVTVEGFDTRLLSGLSHNSVFSESLFRSPLRKTLFIISSAYMACSGSMR